MLHPLTPYHATTSPEDHPLDPRDPSPLLPKKKRKDPRRVFEPRSGQPPGTPQPASSRKAIQRDTAYDDHPDCAVFLVVKPPGANPTNASSPMPTPSSGPRRPGRTGGGVTLEQGPSTPPGPPPPDRGGGGEGGRPPVGSGGGPSRRGGVGPPREVPTLPLYISIFGLRLTHAF